jgi:hypothetical protein
MAEEMVGELGHSTLEESLALTALIAQQDPPKHSRYAVR